MASSIASRSWRNSASILLTSINLLSQASRLEVLKTGEAVLNQEQAATVCIAALAVVTYF
jgi:hypothetical protein